MAGAVDRVDDVNIDQIIYQDAALYDDVSGKELPKQLTIDARKAEMQLVKHHKIYSKRPIKECRDETGEDPVGTKWLEINKGDENNYNIRARLVAQEFTKGKLEKIFAATPPLEAKKTLLSLAVTEGIGWEKDGVIS